MTGTWIPLVGGGERDRTARWIAACADALVDPAWPTRFAPAYAHLDDPAARAARAIGLATGCAGAALLFHRRGHLDDAQALLTRAIEGLGETALDAGLLKGFTGVAWVVAHLASGPNDDDDDPLIEIDDALDALIADPAAARHDLGDGLAGIGLYFLERLPRASATRALDAIVARLAALAIAPANGAWRAWRAAARPQVNLGLAHGMAGVVVFLARVAATGTTAAAAARALLTPAVAYLLAQRWPDRPSRYPGAIDAEHGALPPRHGWCEGDLGIATALSVAGRALDRDDWCAEALATAHHAAGRDAIEGGVVEVGLCHGAAGLMHMFNRLAQRTGDAICREAAVRWLAQTHALAHPDGVAGAAVFHEHAWRGAPGLLMGATGVALALDAAITDTAPTWDRVLGLGA